MVEGQQISQSWDEWRSELVPFEVSSWDSYINMLFIYKLDISQSQYLQKQSQKNRGVGYSTPPLQKEGKSYRENNVLGWEIGAYLHAEEKKPMEMRALKTGGGR